MDLNNELLELKSTYIRLQGDIEKLGSTGNDVSHLEVQLAALEIKITETRNAIKASQK